MHKENINCKDVMHHLCENLGEDIDSPKCIKIKEHLDECENCQSYYRSIEKTIDLYKKYSVEVDKNMHDRLMTFLNIDDSCE